MPYLKAVCFAFGLQLSTLMAPCLAYENKNIYTPIIPYDCDWIERLLNLKTRMHDFLYFQSCSRGLNITQYIVLRGVKQISDNVIWVPSQAIGGRHNHHIEGYMCSGKPIGNGRSYQCSRNGWEQFDSLK